MVRIFYLVCGDHAGANWKVFHSLDAAITWAEKHYKKYSTKTYKIIRAQEINT